METKGRSDVLNVVFDREGGTLLVNTSKGEGGGGSSVYGGFVIVDDPTWFPIEAEDGTPGAVVSDNSIEFYVFTNDEWAPLSAKTDVPVDGKTVVNDGRLSSVGFLESNQNLPRRVWMGSKEEYDSQHKASSEDICLVTDEWNDTDEKLDESSENAVANKAVVDGIGMTLDGLLSSINETLHVSITKEWDEENGCWRFS